MVVTATGGRLFGVNGVSSAGRVSVGFSNFGGQFFGVNVNYGLAYEVASATFGDVI